MTARLTKVRTSVAIHAHRRVRTLLDGAYAATASGRGLDFDDLRAYVVGDDVKDLDWKATARSATPLVRRYVALRQHTVLLAVATGRSMAAQATPLDTKTDLAVLVSGVVGWLAVRHGDVVGLVHGDAETRGSVRTGSTAVHLERLLAAVDEATTTDSPPTDLAALLQHVVTTVRRRSILVVVSDGLDPDADVVALLRRLTAQHEVLYLTIGDLDPTAPVLVGRSIADIDSGSDVAPSIQADDELRREYAEAIADRVRRTRETLDGLGIASEHVTDADGAVLTVLRLLERHRRAARR